MGRVMSSLCTHTQMQKFEIWEPLYSRSRVMLNASKVAEHNKIYFTGNPKTGYNKMGELPYYVSGATVKKYKKESNGSIPVYAVPLEEIKLLEVKEICEHLYN